ncbi:protein trichome birefringence-like 21 [Panicum hallii]|uniref:protein trichome birefringence-like 21 n=1 Tax=Panicum hallii TaxID=206008 RepID=UPI000DF4E00A|nr:protein trichome birefringence-like 21 [Panicum hallii]
MKPQKSSPSSSRKLSVAVATPILLLLALAVVSLYDFSFAADSYQYYIRRASSASSTSSPPANTSSPSTAPACDLTRGQWVPDDEPPYYTNLTCPFIDDLQNCMKFGKPSLEFMRWRWQPDGCDLPRFDAARFLDAMRGRSMAFVGDSLARNHVKSLLCILSQVAQPVEVVTTAEVDVTGRAVRRDFHYGSHGFNVSLFWSPFLVKANLSNAELGLGLWDMHLDTPDARWAAHIADFDYVVLSGTNWFFRPSVYREGGRVVGRNGGAASGAHGAKAEVPVSGAVRAAFRTALGAIAAREGFRGKAFVRTVTPAHFENGEWNTGGDCVRTRPFRRGERDRDAVVAEFRAAQVDALRETAAASQRNGAELRLLDITEAMELRPDGHPSRYGHPPGGSVEGSFVVDCLHWCLPGPIDLWSELLFQMLVAHQ